MTAKLSRKDFTFKSDADGYMIYYKYHPIGGAGVKLPREKPLHWRHRNADLRNNRKYAQVTIDSILDGRIDKHMKQAIDKIIKEAE